METSIFYTTFDSPLGWILLGATADGICMLEFLGASTISEDEIQSQIQSTYPGFPVSRCNEPSSCPMLESSKEAILQYLSQKAPLPSLPLDLRRGTPFQQQVWKELCSIPFGQTRSYLQVAQALGRPKAARAIGQACGKNPIPLIVPCHRVLAAGKRLGGYSGGLHIKKALLEIEGRPQ